ncbi:hypothetical protein AAEU29_03010 [Pseudoalteromonas sp. SSM20]|jgi:hypothetical protein|uniref:hypothetical protein n=2 Tax=unclassified Pseudoalteromonas TaxID=194690 RepID=UPI003BA9D5BC
MSTERRKNKSVRQFVIHALSITAWFFFILALIMFHYARPELEYGVIRYFGMEYRDHWLVTPRNLLILFLILTGIMSSISLFVRQHYNRRSQDSIGVNQISLLIVCIICLLVIVFK